MPIYEYECQACGHRLETIQKFSDAPLTECPACHQNELRKLISAAAFQLKGSGWYVTDFKNSGKKPAAKDDKTDKPADGGEKSGDKPVDSGAKSESKAEASKDTGTSSTPTSGDGE
jgi:putative FmdB family regulatory protein